LVYTVETGFVRLATPETFAITGAEMVDAWGIWRYEL